MLCAFIVGIIFERVRVDFAVDAVIDIGAIAIVCALIAVYAVAGALVVSYGLIIRVVLGAVLGRTAAVVVIVPRECDFATATVGSSAVAVIRVVCGVRVGISGGRRSRLCLSAASPDASAFDFECSAADVHAVHRVNSGARVRFTRIRYEGEAATPRALRIEREMQLAD